MKTTTTRRAALSGAAIALVANLVFLSHAHAQQPAGWRSGYIPPLNTPCPPGYNLQHHTAGGASWQVHGTIGNRSGATSFGGSYTGQRPAVQSSWCVPTPPPLRWVGPPSTMPRPIPAGRAPGQHPGMLYLRR